MAIDNLEGRDSFPHFTKVFDEFIEKFNFDNGNYVKEAISKRHDASVKKKPITFSNQDEKHLFFLGLGQLISAMEASLHQLKKELYFNEGEAEKLAPFDFSVEFNKRFEKETGKEYHIFSGSVLATLDLQLDNLSNRLQHESIEDYNKMVKDYERFPDRNPHVMIKNNPNNTDGIKKQGLVKQLFNLIQYYFPENPPLIDKKGLHANTANTQKNIRESFN